MSTPTYRSGNPSGRASVPGGSGRARVQSGYGSGPPSDPGRGSRSYSGRRRPRWGRIALVLGLALLLVAGVAGLGAFLYYKSLDSGLQRTDAFGKVTGDRPPVVVSG